MAIKRIYLFSGLIYLLTAWFSIGYHNADEHFQILEFAGLKLGLTQPENLAWEYSQQSRQTLQATIAYGIYSMLKYIGLENPFLTATILRLLSAVISFLSIHLLVKALKPEIPEKWFKPFLILSFLLWFGLYCNVRFSSENWSATLFALGFALVYPTKNKNHNLLLLSGLLMGLAFVCRYQMGFMLVGLIGWLFFIKKRKLSQLLTIALGTLSGIGVGILSDRWFYGNWVFTVWTYFKQQIILDKVSSFGIEPWWYYISDTFMKAIPPFSLVFIVSLIWFVVFRAKHAITWAVLPFLLIHMLVGHKELRFLFPIITFMPFVLVKMTEWLIQKETMRNIIMKGKLVKACWNLFWCLNIALVFIVAFRPASNHLSMMRAIYNDYTSPVSLFWLGKNPYHYGKEQTHFYRRSGLDIKQLKSKNQLANTTGKKLVVGLSPKEFESLDVSLKLVYRTFPEWVKHININNWLARTEIWYVYEVVE